MQRCFGFVCVSLIFCAALSETIGLVIAAKEKRGWTLNSAGYLLGPQRTKDTELLESQGDGVITFMSTNSVCVESEQSAVTDVEQLKRMSPDELEILNGMSEEPSPTPSPSDAERVSESAPADLERSHDTTKTDNQDQMDWSSVEKVRATRMCGRTL
uniref:Galanin domain-containing protein n=1 Tax=Labrus bergylta TaxID=56723 RepID=A0A3Q3FDC3_9LABR